MPAKNLYATMTALPGHREKVAELLTNHAKTIRANEPGNVRFVVYTLEGKPDAFHIEETYADEDAFQAHMATDHGKKFNEVITPYIQNGHSDVQFLDLVE